MDSLNGKVALVSGGARDIGRAISVKLASLGASVAFSYYESKEQGDETLAAITKAGGKGAGFFCDVTKEDSVKALVEGTQKAFDGPIHILVNVAGGLVARKTMAEMDVAFWDLLYALNTRSTFLVTKHALPAMADGGSIVNFASQAARDGGGPGAIAYASSKGAVLTMTRGLAKELGPRKIRVNAVSPGMIATTFHDTFTKPEVRQRVASMTPLGREGNASEVADLVAYLAGEGSSFINGEAIDINGGIFFS
ncbi:MAG: SDR family oxidoreductase [Bacteroidetes bacterium]|jgi:3-oxoacyl-[acyl-carrier protein] reductase|nr:SDR family oxidoreductase [Bacteroidota bacterium]